MKTLLFTFGANDSLLVLNEGEKWSEILYNEKNGFASTYEIFKHNIKPCKANLNCLAELLYEAPLGFYDKI